MKKQVSDFLPKATPETKIGVVQGYVPKDLREAVSQHLKEEKAKGNKGLTWDSLLEACLRAYMAERRRA